MRILALTGRAGAGKTTIQNLLVQWMSRFQLSPVRMTIASPIKLFLKILRVEKGHPKFRDAAQALAKMREILGEDCYIQVLSPYGGNLGVVDDLRFPNEALYLRAKYPTLVVRLVRPDVLSTLTPEQMQHESEQVIDQVTADWQEGNLLGKQNLTATRILVKALRRWEILDRLRVYYAGPLSTGDVSRNIEQAQLDCRYLRSKKIHYFLPHTQDCVWPIPAEGEEYQWSLMNSVNMLGTATNLMVYRECPESRGVQFEKDFCDKNLIPRIEFDEFMRIINE